MGKFKSMKVKTIPLSIVIKVDIRVVEIPQSETVKLTDVFAFLKKQNLTFLPVGTSINPKEKSLQKKLKDHWKVYQPIRPADTVKVKLLAFKDRGERGYFWEEFEVNQEGTINNCYIIAMAQAS